MKKLRSEKLYWFLATCVLLAIASSLFFPQLNSFVADNQNVQAFLFASAMGLIGVGILTQLWQEKTGWQIIGLWLCFGAIFVLIFLRLGLAERSHLIEYSLLAFFIHKALYKRRKRILLKTEPYCLSVALCITVSIGTIDELIQLFLPHRIFDLVDIVFNSLAAAFANIPLFISHSYYEKKAKKRN